VQATRLETRLCSSYAFREMGVHVELRWIPDHEGDQVLGALQARVAAKSGAKAKTGRQTAKRIGELKLDRREMREAALPILFT